jgi:P2-related tail formation protein
MRLASILLLGLFTSSVSASTASHRPVREPTSDPASCDRVAAAIVAIMAQDDPIATPARILPLLTRRCVADRWTHAARVCIVAAKSEAAADACESLLSKLQTARVREDVAKLR